MSRNHPDRLLLARALGALDPLRSASLDLDLAGDAALRSRYERLRAQAGEAWWFPDTPEAVVAREKARYSWDRMAEAVERAAAGRS